MAKTASFAVLHFSVAFGVAFALTGDVLVGGAVALIEPAVNTVAFHFHERAWRAIERRRVARASAAPNFIGEYYQGVNDNRFQGAGGGG